jgi:hypothetical protein
MILKLSLIINSIVLMIICTLNLNAQNSISSDSLIGEWVYSAANNLQFGDTVTLLKEMINEKDYTKWIFKTDEEFKSLTVKSGDENRKGIRAESIGVKWNYDNETNTLKIDRGKKINKYRIVFFQSNKIKLVKIK